MNSNFEKFEADVMESIIAEDSAISNILEKQYKSAKIISREFSGFGFFTNFEITDESLKLLGNPNLELGNTQAKIEGLELGAGFVLFIRNGFIKMLECYTYDEPWPQKILSYSLK